MRQISLRTSQAWPCTVLFALLMLYVQAASAIDLSGIWPTTGAGEVVKDTRNVGRFNALKLSTGARVIIQQGDRYSVAVQAEQNVVPLVDTYVEDGVLVVEDNRRFKSSNAEVVITLRHVTSIGTTGSVAVTAQGLSAPHLSVSMGGSSALTLKSVSIGKLRAALGGSSALKVGGVADDFSSELGGSSALQASELEANAISVSSGGSAHATVWAKQSLRLSVGGSSGVSYYGDVHPMLATSGSAIVKSLGSAPQQ